MAYSDLFTRQAGDYARYRPRYPAELFARLAGLGPGTRLAWDCATGNGQAAEGLLQFFDRVVASDAAWEQISLAAAHPRLGYWLGPAEQTPLPSASVDLITVAQAAHWFDLEAFYREARRVLRPGGVLALWAYSIPRVNATVDAVLDYFYREVTGPYWSPRRKLVDDGYRSLPFPFAQIDQPADAMRLQWMLADLFGFLSSWSAVQKFIERRGYHPFRDVQEALRAAWGDPETMRKVHFPIYLRVGRA